ncbi:hypothetical protein K7G98_10400, partial [Saccharothrix sp. MB29]|nr:hypothetical protein [Saccharothrix sp. MB29]
MATANEPYANAAVLVDVPRTSSACRAAQSLATPSASIIANAIAPSSQTSFVDGLAAGVAADAASPGSGRPSIRNRPVSSDTTIVN